MRTSIFCWAGILLLALPGCGDDSDTDRPDDDKEICGNGQDDDADGLVDCTDSDCAAGCAATCGNGAVEPGEACDGADLGGQTCEGLGYLGGTLACSSSCTLDPSGCDPIPGTCGNGMLDAGEACDDAEFGGQSCESLGFAGGILVCSAACALDTSGCVNVGAEVCGNGQDDDGNGLIDCMDPACAADPSCSGGGASCARPLALTDGVPVSGDTTHGGAVAEAICTGGLGALERVYAFTTGGNPGESGVLQIELESATDQGIYVRTDCADQSTELKCVDASTGGTNEVLELPIEGGQTIYIYVDGYWDVAHAGPFTLVATWGPVGNEAICDDFADNDFDYLFDCEDPDCQGTPACEPGMTPTGSPCDAHSECVASNYDPICLTENNDGWPEGYCSEYCDLALNDCSSGAVCADTGLPSGNGLCLDACTTHADCRAGYYCEAALGGCFPGSALEICDNGVDDDGNGLVDCMDPTCQGTPACPPEICDNGADDNGDGLVDCMDPTCDGNPICPELACDDLSDNDGNGLFDCEDPGCQATMACAPGAGAAGVMCTANAECAANMNDPICVTEAFSGWSGGYCSQFCDLANDDCPSGSACLNSGLSLSHGICFDLCTTNADCRAGYQCSDAGGGVSVCYGS